MSVEAKAYFLKKIPVSPRVPLPVGEMLPTKTHCDIAGLISGIVFTPFRDNGLDVYFYAEQDEALRVLNEQQVEAPRDGKRQVFTRGEINNQRLWLTTLLPGVKLKVIYDFEDNDPNVITLSETDYCIVDESKKR
ncbi:MAG: hypothetical protein M1524_04240 [Patescibacteria group bacterium]|nr:hypothetical protein [Patescibacteria group bacterium]